MGLSAISSNLQHFIQGMQPSEGRYSMQIPKVGYKTAILFVTVLALANLPGADAGVKEYGECIRACMANMGPGWASTMICLILCAPCLAAPG